jgi:hypothetical protein
MGDSSKEGEKDKGVSVEMDVCDTLGNEVEERKVTVNVSAVREPAVWDGADGDGRWVLDGPGAPSTRGGGDARWDVWSMGSVSARSTTVLKSSIYASHAISLVSLTPAEAIVRMMIP